MRVLVLGGTTEGAALARLLAGDGRFEAELSLAGITRRPRPQALPTRTGGFGGAEGLARYLGEHGVAALVDATHPFAERITRNAAEAARLTGVPMLRVDRPAWVAGAGDRWTEWPDMAAAARALGEVPRRVLLTVGQKDLAPFLLAPWHRYTVRAVDPPDPGSLPPGAEVIAATGPFEEAAERALLVGRGIEVIVSKNSGGSATAAKLSAARALGLPVLLVARPVTPAGLDTVPDAGAAQRWLERRHAGGAERGV